MTGNVLLVFILSQVATNGYWIYYAVIKRSHPFILIPIISTIVLISITGTWIFNNWYGVKND